MISFVKVKGFDASYAHMMISGLTTRNCYVVRRCAVIVASLVHLILLASLFQTISADFVFRICYGK
jgi:hypothetical protein